VIIDSTHEAQPIEFPHFALVYTVFQNCPVEKYYSLKATHTGLGLSECINRIRKFHPQLEKVGQKYMKKLNYTSCSPCTQKAIYKKTSCEGTKFYLSHSLFPVVPKAY